MPVIRKAALVCDRCGAEQEFSPETKDPIRKPSLRESFVLAGWSEALDGACLCPVCSGLCAEIVERHQAELREFIGAATVESEI